MVEKVVNGFGIANERECSEVAMHGHVACCELLLC